MRISLDQPTFLTSLTEEKPANNQTDSGGPQDDFPDFLTSLNNQGNEAASTETPSLNTSITNDETPSKDRDLTMDDVANLLLTMGYLAETAKKSIPAEVPVGGESVDPQLDALNVGDAQGLTSSPLTSTQNGQYKPELLTKAIETEGTTDAMRQAASQGRESMLQSALPAVRSPMLNPDKINHLREEVKSNPRHPLLGTEALSNDGKYKAVSAELVKSDLKSNFILSTETPPSFNSLPDEKVVTSLQQMGVWLQAKVNASPAITQGLVRKQGDNEFGNLQSVSSVSGAATPAKAAFEAKVEISQSMSNAELNLTTYHANIKIYPPELGKITAKMKMDRNVATLEITAENKQVKALIQGHLSSLREQFSQSNIQLSKIEIVLADDKTSAETTAKDQGQQQTPQEAVEEATRDISPEKPKSTKKRSENVVDAYV